VRIFGLFITLAIGILVHSDPVIADQARPDLGTIFNRNYHQVIDRFGTVSRAAFDESGRLIGVRSVLTAPANQTG
jgi:hypothetical protein